MTKLRRLLVEQLKTIDGLEDRPSKVAGGSAIFFRNKEIAHFHGNNEIDIRLTKGVIKQEDLTHPTDSRFHPGRKPGSHWIELRFRSEAQVKEVVRLFQLALDQY